MSKQYKIYKVYFEQEKTIFVYLDITKQNLKNRLYTHRNYSKKTGKLRKMFKNRDIFIDVVDENFYDSRQEAKDKLIEWKNKYNNMEGVKLIEHIKNINRKSSCIKIINCECGSKIRYNSYNAHIKNKKHLCYLQNKGVNNKFESFIINFDA